MKFHIITLFPESFNSYFGSSILARAREKGLFEVVFYNLSDFSDKKFKQVDDKAYGMHGQVLSPEPLSRAIESILESSGPMPILACSPRGELLTQPRLEHDIHNIAECIILCGHYEGIDERIFQYYKVKLISIGEYVISSGELAAMVYIDALVRHIPGVLGNPQSLEEESFSARLGRQKEYPVYTRPEIFLGLRVPPVLLSGNHQHIEDWKHDNLS